MADSKIFKLLDNVDADMVARGIEAFLRDKKKLTAESLKTPEGWLIQAKQSEGWKKFAGMDTAIQVQLMPTGELLTVNIGSGKWIDKAGAATVGMILFAPLAVTAAIGAWGQKKLPPGDQSGESAGFQRGPAAGRIRLEGNPEAN